MNKRQFLALAGVYATPVLVIFCGLILVFSPDSASILVSRLLAAVLTAGGIITLLGAFVSGGEMAKKLLTAAVLLIASRWLSANPLGLAAGLSRILGICLLLGAAGSFFRSVSGGGKALSVGEAVLGIVLILLPLFASRLVFTLCGIAVTVAGITMLLNARRKQKYLDGGRPDIIDAL